MDLKHKVKLAKTGAILSVLGLGAYIGVRSVADRDRAESARQVVILERVKSLGDLHVARYSFSEVVDHATRRKAEGFASAIPFVPELVSSTTENRVLMNATGSVEAGIDLSQAKFSRDTAGGWVGTLPPVEIYPAQVSANVIQSKRGMFWRDENLVPNAIERTKDRFTESATRGGIVDRAKRDAEIRLRSMINAFGIEKIRFVWDSDSKS